MTTSFSRATQKWQRSLNRAWLIVGTIVTSTLFYLPSEAQEAETPSIKLEQIDGRDWLVDSEGQPFFAHGVTHVLQRNRQVDYKDISKAFKDLGFNAYGYGCPRELKGDMPFLEGKNYVPISTYRSDGSFHFIDIFDPRVQAELEEQIKEVCLQNRTNPNLIGYFWTDLAAWPLENSVGKNWVDFVRSLPPDASGQRAYRDYLETRPEGNSEERDLGFLRIIAREYFRVFGEANRKHDPGHLIFGDRFAFNTLEPVVLQEMLPWVDAIAIQPPFRSGFPRQEFDRIHKLAGKPILICDFAIRFRDGEKAIRGWKPEANAGLAGERYAEYIRDARETPYVIGAFWCNPIDSKPGFSKAGIKQGLFGPGLRPRRELNQSIGELNRYLDQMTPRQSDRPQSPR